MKVESIAECSSWSILQYFWTALSDNRWSWKPISGHLFEWPLKTGLTIRGFREDKQQHLNVTRNFHNRRSLSTTDTKRKRYMYRYKLIQIRTIQSNHHTALFWKIYYMLLNREHFNVRDSIIVSCYIPNLSYVFKRFCTNGKSKKDSKDQESIQSSTTPVPGYQMGK